MCFTIYCKTVNLAFSFLQGNLWVEHDILSVMTLALEKAQIEALINKHKPHTPKTPDEVNILGTGKNANIDGKERTEKGKPPHKKATKASQIKTSQNKGDKSHEGKLDTLFQYK